MIEESLSELGPWCIPSQVAREISLNSWKDLWCLNATIANGKRGLSIIRSCYQLLALIRSGMWWIWHCLWRFSCCSGRWSFVGDAAAVVYQKPKKKKQSEIEERIYWIESRAKVMPLQTFRNWRCSFRASELNRDRTTQQPNHRTKDWTQSDLYWNWNRGLEETMTSFVFIFFL